MVDNGAKTASLDAGGSYTIPAGYHNGSGKVTAAALSGQTPANAAASDILSGKNAWVNGVKVNGSMLSAPSYPNELTAKQMHCYGSSYTSHDGNNIYMQIPESRYYASGTWIGFSDSDLVPANIKNGVSIGSSEKPVVGTFTSDANAAASHILRGYSGYVKGSKINGSMPNRGAAGTSLNAGGSYTIPAGYHNGSGKVTANSLASQTSANAGASHIRSGYTAWVNGSKITGNLAIQSALSFSAAALSATSIRISWKNPSKGPWQGVFIQMSTSGYPGTGGGTRVYTGAGNNPSSANGSNYVDIGGLASGTTYYFTCTSYVNALGWGNSYNVSCKARGEIIYDNGKNLANLEFGAPPVLYPGTTWENWWLTNTKVRFNSDHIDIPSDFTNHYSPEFIFGSSINVSAFSKIFAEVQIVNVSAAYEFNCVVRIYNGSTDLYDSSAYVDIRSYKGRRLTTNCPLTYKNGSFKGIKFCTYRKQYSYGATGIKIYKIWAE